jgi:hypothetical protein
MRCNFTGRPSGRSQTPCPCILQRCGGVGALPRQARLCRLQCNAATPPEASGAGGGAGASPSSRFTPQPLKQALPGYVSSADEKQLVTPSSSSPSGGLASGQQPSSSSLGSLERGGWDWWTAYFNAMDDTVRELDGVDEELSAAVAEEDYSKAAALRLHQNRLENADCVSAILKDMQTAIEEERYNDAAALRDAGGAGLMGWWAGRADGDDPHGHLIHISADFGRYVAHAYTGINLAELAGLTDDPSSGGGGGNGASGNGSSATVSFSTTSDAIDTIGPARESLGEDSDPGAPVFEVFIRNDIDNPTTFIQQPTALHAPASALASPAVLEDLTELLAREVGENASVSVERGTGDDGVGFVRINVTGVAGNQVDMDDANALPESSSSSDEDDDGEETDGFRNSTSTNTNENSEETIHTIDDLIKIFEEQERAENNSSEQNSPLSSSSAAAGSDNSSTNNTSDEETTGTTSPADEMVDAWVEIDGRLKKMRLEEVVASAVAGAAAAAAADDDDDESDDASTLGVRGSSDSEDDDSDGDDDGGDRIIEIGDTLSEMGLGAVAQRVPASIEWAGRDAFTFVVAEDLKLFEDSTTSAEIEVIDLSQTEMVEIFNKNDVDDVNENAENIRRKEEELNASAAKKSGKKPAFSGRLDEIDSIVRSAMGQAIAEGIGATSPGSLDGVLGLSGRINYTRLPLNDPPTDVFSGIYLGTFGPHGPEILRVARATIENEEWVQGTKLTGDPNVPAGKVSFRARIGVQHRLSPTGVYPPEYGVQQRYKGQGRVAREGYSAAKWVDGELLTFSAANPMTRGAELGFVFNIDASRKYLLLFTKVKLDKILPMMN